MLGRARKSELQNDWTVADAKAKFSELLEKARTGPQTITRHGRPAAVVVSPAEWEHKKMRSGTLADFFAQSPLRGSGLKVRKSKQATPPIRL